MPPLAPVSHVHAVFNANPEQIRENAEESTLGKAKINSAESLLKFRIENLHLWRHWFVCVCVGVENLLSFRDNATAGERPCRQVGGMVDFLPQGLSEISLSIEHFGLVRPQPMFLCFVGGTYEWNQQCAV